MDSHDLLLIKKHTNSHIFKDTIQRVWYLVRDQVKTDKIFQDFRSPVKFLKGENTYEIGNEFSFLYMKEAELVFRCDEVIEEENFKKILWKVQPNQYKIKYDFVYSLYSNTLDKSTVMIWEIIYEKEAMPIPRKLKEVDDIIRADMLGRLDYYLRKNSDNLFQIESVIINEEREKVWNIITNWSKLQKIVPTLADEVLYDGDPLSVNTKCKLQWNTKNMEFNIKVKKVLKENPTDDWEYVLECYDGRPKVPLQELHFKLIHLPELKYTYLQFQHVFKEPLKYEMIESIIKDKKNILSSVRKHLEKEKKKGI